MSKRVSCGEESKGKHNNKAYCGLQRELKKRLLDVTDEEGSARKILKVNPRCDDEYNKAYYGLQQELKKRLLDVTDEEGSARKILKVNPRCDDESEKGIPLNPKTYQWSESGQQNPPIAQLDLNCLLNCFAHCMLSDFGSMSTTNRIFRSFVKSNELYRLRRAKGLVDHWIYFSCDPNEWQAYDLKRDRWLRIPSFRSSVVFYNSDKESLAVGTQLLVFGIDGAVPIIYQYSFLTNKWTSGMQMNFPRFLFGSATLGEIGIIAGGRDSKSDKLLTTAEIYNSETGEWTVIPSMHKARKMCSSVIMDGKYYVIGGTGEGDNMLRCAEVYDLKLKKWTLIPDMLPERGEAKGGRPESPPLLAVVKNELYAAYYAQREVRKYDKSLNIWTTVGNLPPRTETHKGWGMAFRACGDHLVVVGGPRSRVSGILEINACVPRDGEMLQWRLVVAKPGRSYVYNCAIMGC